MIGMYMDITSGHRSMSTPAPDASGYFLIVSTIPLAPGSSSVRNAT
jgi:hypothetical protein